MAAKGYITVTSGKSKTVALLLCIFLGVFGVHYFYVGRMGMGILYLLTGGIFIIGVIVDVIRILMGTFRDNSGTNLLK